MTPECKRYEVSFNAKYVEFEKFADLQSVEFYWTHNSISLEQDIGDILTAMTKTQRDAICYLQKIFTHYEGWIGEEYWGGRWAKMFKRHEFRRWGATAAFVELQVHAPFYRRLNELMSLEVPGFYEEYKHDPELSERMGHISSMISDPNDLVSIASFTLLEGVSLFAPFAFFKSFQSNGYNLIPKFVSGINLSARDEALHAKVGAVAYRILRDELELTTTEVQILSNKIREVAKDLLTHEVRIMEKVFQGVTSINGVTLTDYQDFIMDRTDIILKSMDIPIITAGKLVPKINGWFYDSINSYHVTDFFKTKTREYVHSWDREKFSWRNV